MIQKIACRFAVAVFMSAVAAPLATAAQTAEEPGRPLLHELFQDHAVLQRERPISIWGEAEPGEHVSVTLGEATAHAEADADGRWSAVLPAMDAGGPFDLEAVTDSGARQAASDILVGDVWLCSGQSNMELQVRRARNAAGEIAGAANDRIRLLSVAHDGSPAPRAHFITPVTWSAASPETVPDFSAACYFFARELQRDVDVPMGLISSSWGGSRIEPWIDAAQLRALGGFDEDLDLLTLYARDPAAGNQRMGGVWQDWWRANVLDAADAEPWSMDAAVAGWPAAPEPMRDWKTWGVPELADHNGMVWYRTSVTLTAEQAAQAATLSLGGIDEIDQTWVNGQPIGNTFGWGTARNYALPSGVLREGENVVVVNVVNTWAAGGMYGPSESMALHLGDGASVSLAGDWTYDIAPLEMGLPPRAPWETIGGLTNLHNAMIAPLSSYGLQGVLWYQGESNTGDGDAYEGLVTALMASWRAAFGEDVAVLVVQLPNFGDRPSTPGASGWAEVREAQRRAVARDANAGLVVTIDIGNAVELHPTNKQDVGVRLARAARHVVYGEPIASSGPAVQTARRTADGAIAVAFGDVEGALVTLSSDAAIGFELCGAEQVSCRFVIGAVEGDHVRLAPADGSDATRVRFCWGGAPLCNLYDGSGLPAGPFELVIE